MKELWLSLLRVPLSSFRWAYRFFRIHGNGRISSLKKAFLLRKGHQVSIYPLGKSVISEIRDKWHT